MSFYMQRVALATFIGFTLILLPISGQQLNADASQDVFTDLVKSAFGLDQELVNGAQYYNRHPRSMFHPYFSTPAFQMGSVTLRTKIYEEVRIKYDLYYQHLEIGYKNLSGGNNQVISVTDRVEAFSFGVYHFKKLNLEGKADRFYQVIATDHFTCYVFWEKGLVPLSGNTTYTEQFTGEKRTLYLFMDGDLHGFSSRSDFSDYFPEENKKEIKRGLKSSQFKFRTAPPGEIIRMMEVVSSTLEGNEM